RGFRRIAGLVPRSADFAVEAARNRPHGWCDGKGKRVSDPNLRRRLAAEFVGTAFLLATVIGSGIMAAKLAGGNGALALLCNTLPTGAILTVLILIFGAVSGAHFNPAVTLAFAFRRELPPTVAAIYVAVQV